MTDQPDFLADRPGENTDLFVLAEGRDALSEVLETVRLRGRTVLRCAPPPPSAIEVPAGVRALHIVERGPLVVRDPSAALTLATGDLVLLARGEAHTLETTSDTARTASTPASDSPTTSSAGLPGGRPTPAGSTPEPRPLRPTDRYTGADPDTPRWLTGTFTVEDTLTDPLLAVLPPMIVVPAEGQDWLAASLPLLLAEVSHPSPGGAVMISRILDLLFVHALRDWGSRGDHGPPGARGPAAPGWLTAASDPAIGRVLTVIHRDLARPWTLAELADVAALSRTVFAARFTDLLGTPPATYLTHRRLDHAAQLLRAGTTSVTTVAKEVGYTSEAAFSRAFRRHHGTPPTHWRRTGDTTA